MRYRGRFAPTPSGPLHAGSLSIALAGWLAARQAGGEWLLRFDDLDTPRCPAGADATILRQLEAHGLQWDGTPDYQSKHRAAYAEVLDELASAGQLYACLCTRALLAVSQFAGPDGPVYPDTCRPPAALLSGSTSTAALRFAIPDAPFSFHDALLGRIERQPQDIGDFVLRRADGQIGYQLACVVDEARLHITEVVRGRDLLGSSIRQQILMIARQQAVPEYLHLPLVPGPDGRKLSKQNGAPGLDPSSLCNNLWLALGQLGMIPPAEARAAPVAELLAWALARFNRSLLPRANP